MSLGSGARVAPAYRGRASPEAGAAGPGGRGLALLAVLGMVALSFGCRSAPAARGDEGAVPMGTPGETAPRQEVRADYVGGEGCRSCHRAEHARFAATDKGRLFLEAPRTAQERTGCEACHGPGSLHEEVEGREPVPGFVTFASRSSEPVATRNAVCLSCHSGSGHVFWEGSPHEARRVACTDCHSIMTPGSESALLKGATVMQTCASCHQREVAAQRLGFSRMPLHEEKMGCSSCHDAHGSPTEKLLVSNSANDTCFSCHSDKRGPFLWEHAPVTESCMTCHDPHGGRNAGMLSVPMPRLCQQCHVASGHPSDPQAAASRFVLSRQCANCHVAVHGSNHPSGMLFVR